MNKLTLTLAANDPRRFSVPSPARYWRIVSAPAGAALSLIFDDASATDAVPGRWGYRMPPRTAFSFIMIESTVAGDVTLEWAFDEIAFDTPGILGSGSALNVVLQPPSGVVEVTETALAIATAADVSLNVATSVEILSVGLMLDPAAPGPVRFSLDATAAAANRGTWLNPGEFRSVLFTARSVVGFRAVSWYNPNAVTANIVTQTYLR
jgi:hypothetical protein